MEIQELDLQKYAKRVFEISMTIYYQYPRTKKLSIRLAMIRYELQGRRLFKDNINSEISLKWEKHFKEKSKLIEIELEEIESINERYNFDKETLKIFGNDAFQIEYFLPNADEIIEIKKNRKESFDFEMKEFKRDFALNPKPKSLFIKEVLKKKTYKYRAFYEKGEPLQMGILYEKGIKTPRYAVLYNFANDLGIYDFIQEITEKKETNNRIENLESVENQIVSEPKYKPKKDSTMIEYRGYVIHYIERLERGENEEKAKNGTVRYFDIDRKTLYRAINNFPDIMSKFQDKFYL